jgi:hypothetical protein
MTLQSRRLVAICDKSKSDNHTRRIRMTGVWTMRVSTIEKTSSMGVARMRLDHEERSIPQGDATFVDVERACVCEY